MRYYDLRIIDPASKKVTLSYGSYPGGSYDAQALNVLFDLMIATQAQPRGNSGITLEGVPQSILTNAQNFAGQQIELRGGMGVGLPLANPTQAGLLVQGTVFQVYSNWVGTQVDINFVINPSVFTLKNPGPFVLNWRAGTPLQTALTNTLQAAYPSATIKMNIADIVLPMDEIGFYPTLTQLASVIGGITASNVQIVINGDVVTVYDSTYKPTPRQLQFTDFVGQPMWIEPNTIQAWTVLRADLSLGDMIKMPQGMTNQPGFVQTQASSLPSQIKYQSAIQGSFVVTQLRHIGDMRQPNGRSWCTVINAVSQTPTT